MQTLQIQNFTADEMKNFIREAVQDALPQTQAPAPQSPEYITRHEAAKRLGVSLVTIDKWSHEGYLQKLRIGGRIRFKAADLSKGLELVKNLKYKRP